MVYQSQKHISYRSTIRKDTLEHTLKRGTLLGGFGISLLLMGGTILPFEMLSRFGISFFIVGLFFIGIGLLPYRRLSDLQLKPHEIHYDGEHFLFLKQGKALFQVPLVSIKKISYLEQEHLYGIGIWLKKPIEQKIKVLQKELNFASFMADSRQRFEGCDLFFPYFSKKTAEELQSSLH